MTHTAPPSAPSGPPHAAADATPQDIAALADAAQRLRQELAKRIVGQADVIELLLIAVLSRGHGLFIGVPGLAKTLLISTLAQATSLRFNRIQFTPDLMPSDITGSDVLEQDQATGRRSFEFIPGPLFCQLLLADEVNRTPPKTQAALLQAMQERRVTASGKTYPLEAPFLVFATQNPIEQEGTYPLPEAQLDRFMFSIDVGYPTLDEEVSIVSRTTGAQPPPLSPVLDSAQLVRFQGVVLGVVAAPSVVRYAVALVHATRPAAPGAPELVRRYVSWGAGPRASQFLILGAKARAALAGRPHASIDDVRAVARPVLQHRTLLNFQAEAERVSVADVLGAVLEHTPAPGA